jgi:hypothetical protein
MSGSIPGRNSSDVPYKVAFGYFAGADAFMFNGYNITGSSKNGTGDYSIDCTAAGFSSGVVAVATVVSGSAQLRDIKVFNISDPADIRVTIADSLSSQQDEDFCLMVMGL